MAGASGGAGEAVVDGVTGFVVRRPTQVDSVACAISRLLRDDELRSRMPDLRAREASLRGQLAALDAQAADRDAYLTLTGNLEGFLARLRGSAPRPAPATAGASCGCWSRTS